VAKQGKTGSASASPKTNKSQAIRDCKKAHPSHKPAAIANALRSNGIDVSAQFVSTILSNSKKRKKIRKPGRPKGSVAGGKKVGSRNPSHDDVSFESLLKVKQIVIELGGIPQAKAALRALEQLMV
jgi:hypothetical protein